MRKYDTILFDLDGTLLNTIEDITDAINITLEDIGISKKVDLEITRFCIGSGAYILIDRVSKLLNLSSEEKVKFASKYFDNYSKRVNVKTKPFDKVIETLKFLKEANYTLAVISNKPNRDVYSCIDNYFPNLFNFCVGQIDGIPTKPNKAIFDKVVELYHIDKEKTIYVGDMDVDIDFSRNIGIKVVICKHGYGTIDTIKNADYLIERFDDLINILERENEETV